jgi:hypothetical protein
MVVASTDIQAHHVLCTALVQLVAVWATADC